MKIQIRNHRVDAATRLMIIAKSKLYAYSFTVCFSEISHVYSSVPNRRVVPNKRAGGKIHRKN